MNVKKSFILSGILIFIFTACKPHVSINEYNDIEYKSALTSDCSTLLVFTENTSSNGYDLYSTESITLKAGSTVNDITKQIPGFTVSFIGQIDQTAYAFYSRNTITATFKLPHESEDFVVKGKYGTDIPGVHVNLETVKFPAEDITISENWHKNHKITVNFKTNYGTSRTKEFDCCTEIPLNSFLTKDEITTEDERNALTIGTLQWIDSNNQPLTKIEKRSEDLEVRASWKTIVSPQKNSYVFIEGRTVTLPYGVWISPHEVTQKEYVDITQKSNPSFNSSNPANEEIQENRPVEQINFFDAVVYCNLRSIAEGFAPCYSINNETNPENWGEIPVKYDSDGYEQWCAVSCDFTANGYRLPTEAEWEFAALAGKNYPYSGSETLNSVGWNNNNSAGISHEICQLQPNDFNLYDMTGNVSEWCWDLYNAELFDSTPFNGPSEPYFENNNLKRSSRGGSYGANATYNNVYKRNFSDITERVRYMGMRVCRTIATEPEVTE